MPIDNESQRQRPTVVDHPPTVDPGLLDAGLLFVFLFATAVLPPPPLAAKLMIRHLRGQCRAHRQRASRPTPRVQNATGRPSVMCCGGIIWTAVTFTGCARRPAVRGRPGGKRFRSDGVRGRMGWNSEPVPPLLGTCP